LWIQGYAVGARGVDGEEAADTFPDAGGLDCVFLRPWLVQRHSGKEYDGQEGDGSRCWQKRELTLLTAMTRLVACAALAAA
jgi:hypothetical protein